MTKVRFHRAVVSLFLGAASVSAGAACSGGHEDVVLPPPPQEVDATYGIRAYGTFGGETKVLTFGGPTNTRGALGTLAEPRSSASLAGLRSYDLLRMAASECGLGARGGTRPSAYNKASHRAYGASVESGVDLAAVSDPTSPSSVTVGGVGFSIFSAEATTCDQQIDQEEILLCAAERLASLADSEVPVTWAKALPGITGDRDDVPTADIGPGIGVDLHAGDVPIVFPVLDPKTKFLARDLALQALAYIPLLDARSHTIGNSLYTCSELYATAPTIADLATKNAAFNKLYNYPAIPDPAGTPAPAPVVAPAPTNGADFYPPIETWPPTNKRLDHLTQILRGAGQLTKQLIEQSVDSDLAAAADKIAAQSDEERLRSLWIAPTDTFNSMAHAARILYGRQATLGFEDDATLRSGCTPEPTSTNWLTPDKLWTFYAPPAFLARGMDRVLRTRDDLEAERLVSAAGLFAPAAEIDDLATVRSTLNDALGDLASGSGTRSQLRAQLNLVSDGALTNALLRQGAAAGVRLNGDPRTMDATEALDALGGGSSGANVRGRLLVAPNRIARDVGAPDAAAAFGMLQGASTCKEFVGSQTVFGGRIASAAAPADARWQPRHFAFAMQDAFAVAQLIRSRAIVLRAAAPAQTPGTPARDGMVNELDTWAGGLRVVGSIVGGTTTSNVQIDLFDIDLSAFKSSTPVDDFVLVTGSTPAKAALAAARVAGTADGSGPLPGTAYPASPISLGVVAENDPSKGLLRKRVQLTFNDLPAGAFLNQPVFVVRKGTTSSPGIVLGALREPSGTTVPASFAYSPFRRELVERIFAYPKTSSTLGGSLGDTRDMCIPNVPRDLYVPMESETTSDGDAYESSWKHYLTLARQAADKADGLGRELLQIGFDTDTRKEGFAMQAQDSNGGLPIDCVKVVNGKVDASKCPPPLDTFLNERTVDALFLTSDPIKSNNKAADDRAKLREVLQCDAPGAIPSAACAKLTPSVIPTLVDASNPKIVPEEVGQTRFYYAALGLPAAPETSAAPVESCTAVAEHATGTYSDDLEPALAAAKLDDTDGAAAATSGLRVEVDLDGEFRASISGGTFLDSRVTRPDGPNLMWPGCARSPNSAASCFAAANANAPRNTALAKAFGRCAYNGAIGCGGDVQAALTGIRWDLEGATWLAHSMTGQIPAGAITTPIPVADFGPDGSEAPASDHACAPVISAVGTGRWEQVGNLRLPAGASWASSLPSEDVRLLAAAGGAVPIQDAFHHMPVAPQFLPTWYQAIYSPSSATAGHCFAAGTARPGGSLQYLHVATQTEAGSWMKDRADQRIGGRLGLSRVLAENTGIAVEGIGPGLIGSERVALARWKDGVNGNEFAGFLGQLKANFDDGRYGKRLENTYGLQSLHPEAWEGKLFNSSTGDVTGPFRRFISADRFTAPTCFENQLTHYGCGFKVSTYSYDEVPAMFGWYGVGGSPLYETTTWWPCNEQLGDRANWGKCVGSPIEARPTSQSLSQRARFFVNSGAPRTDAEARRQFVQSQVLTCLGGAPGALLTSAAPPNVASADDLLLLQSWLRGQRRVAAQRLASLVAEDVPLAVVQSFKARNIGATALGGRAGEAALGASAALERTAASYRTVLAQIDAVDGAIGKLRNSLDKADKAKAVNDAQRRVEDYKAIMDVVGSIATTLTGPASVGNLVGFAVNSTNQALVTSATAQLRNAEDKLADAQRRELFIDFAEQLRVANEGKDQALSTTRQAAIDFQTALLRIKTERAKSLDLLARASGAGVWECKTTTGKTAECTSPVNTVLNRRFAATKIRYEAALRDARTLAYIARRAIEQRFGQRLDQVRSPIGPLEAPSSWADSVCSLQGIDYESLRKETLTGANGKKLSEPEVQAWNDGQVQRLAKANVTDYVDRLQRFVDYYPIAFPSHDGDDTTVLSFREDALRNTAACAVPAPNNLLASSDEAFRAANALGDQLGQWQVHLCPPGQALCSRISQHSPIKLQGGSANATWLRSEARLDSETSGRDEVGISAPGNFVSQSVFLDPGSYVLSFYAASLDASGAPSTTPANYRVAALSEDGAFVATGVYQAELGTSASGTTTVSLSQRRTLAITVANRGLYRIGFAPSAQPGGVGSIGLVQPQLQRDERAEGPTAYEPTDSERMTPSSDCPSTPAQLRGNFTRKCENNRCFYELNTPISIDSAAFTVNGNPLQNKLAAANFNYRHIDIAVNLVGTGLRSCDANPTPACYASGTVDYDLLHEANGIGIVAYDAAPRVFDFGTGRISSGKALATERYLTLPLSGADASLVSQQGVLKTELRGRPIDGRYTLRVYDNPALRWEKLEDIQLLLHTRYWSRVDSPSSF